MKRNLSYAILVSICTITIAVSQTEKPRKKAKRIVKSELIIPQDEMNDNAVIDMGEALQAAILENDIEAYMSKLDTPHFIDTVMKDIDSMDGDPGFVEGFRSGVAKGLRNLPTRIANEVNEGSYYDFISYRYDETAQTYYLLFRLFSIESGLNYHDYKVSKMNNEFSFSDIYVYLSGEHLSKTMNRLLVLGLPEGKRIELVGSDNGDYMNLYEGTMLYRQGKAKEAYDKFDALTNELAKEKYVLIMKSQMAGQFDDELYMKVIKDMIVTYPDDNTLYLNYIDYYTMIQDWKNTFHYLNRLQNETEDDFLYFVKGSTYYAKGDIESAKSHFEYIMENYTDFFYGYATYMSCLIVEKNYEAIVNTLNLLVDQGYEKETLIEYIEEPDEYGENEFEPLMAAEAYIKWKNE